MFWLPTLAGLIIASLTTPLVLSGLRKLKVTDVASERSSHTGVAIRGVGIATLLGVMTGLSVGSFLVEGTSKIIMLLIALFSYLAALVGAFEDIRGLSVRIRASIQVLIAALATVFLSTTTSTSWMICAFGIVFIAGYINAANFMDGVNGISAIHGIISGVFYICLGLLTDISGLVIIGGVLAGCFLAFLPWNLMRHGTFLGDTGSYLLGALISISAIAAWMAGIHPVIALAPAIIYCVDTGGTLLRRLLRGEAWYEPHRTHVYQRLTDQGLSHVGASTLVGIITGLVASATLLLLHEETWTSVLAYFLIGTLCLLYWFLPNLIEQANDRRHARSTHEVMAR